MVEEVQRLRRGLPRVPGGEPWPPVGESAAADLPTASAVDPPAASASRPPAPSVTEPTPPPVASVDPSRIASTAMLEVPLRRGLPRVPGGEPWPPAGVSLVAAPAPVAEPESVAVPDPHPAPAPATPPTPTTPVPRSATKEQRRYRGRTIPQWIRFLTLWLLGIIAAAGIIVLAGRGLTTLPGVPEFLERFPGEYELPVPTEDGFPAWARWTHFLNFFFMILVIRSGMLVRQQQQPDAFYTPKRGGKKVSIYLWLHTSIDVLWILNGVIFVILLFATGHWARIVPTSWEVFPNAASALLQYLTLEWPTENGWVNYNSLQQLMYFVIVFIAAPLAAITGIRMSEWWPKDAERLNRLYPAPLARAIHFPTMLFFSLFIIVHVFLVFATGALRNLNHMFAGSDTVSWVGFWWFTAGLVVTVGITAAARPLVLAPIAGISGRVSNR